MASTSVDTDQLSQLEELHNQLESWEFWTEPKKLNLAEVWKKFNVDVENDDSKKRAEAPQQNSEEPETTLGVVHTVLQWYGYGHDNSDANSTTLENTPEADCEQVSGRSASPQVSDFDNSWWVLRSIDPKDLWTYRRMLLVFYKYIDYERDYLYRGMDRLEYANHRVRDLQNENARLRAKLQAAQAVTGDDDVADLAGNLDKTL